MTVFEYRAAVRGLLPERAFLKRGRDSLFVTDAEKWGPLPEKALSDMGFTLDMQKNVGESLRYPPTRATAFGRSAILAHLNKITRIDPGESLIFALERDYPTPPDRLSAELLRFRLTENPDIPLFSACCRALDEGKWDETLDKALRIRAAEACRTDRGGGLYACAVVLALIRQSTYR